MAELVKTLDKTEYSYIPPEGLTPTVRIGGRHESVDKFVPVVESTFGCETGSEQFFFVLNRHKVRVNGEKEILEGSKIQLTVEDETDIWNEGVIELDYGLFSGLLGEKPQAIVEEVVALKWDVQINKKPLSNRWEWIITHSVGISFEHQPELTEERKKTDRRPEPIVDSYAVYCDRMNQATFAGKAKHNYGFGKLAHLYYPIFTDSNGLAVRAESFIITRLSKTTSLMVVTAPQDFLDNSVYPITLDPELGYGVDAGGTVGAANYYGVGDVGEMTEAGTLTGVKYKEVRAAVSATEVIGVVYTDNSGTPQTLMDYSTAQFGPGGSAPSNWFPGWTTTDGLVGDGTGANLSLTLDDADSLTSGNRYYAGRLSEHGVSGIYYDTVAGWEWWVDSSNDFVAGPDDWDTGSDTEHSGERMFAFIVYDAVGGGLSIPIAHYYRQSQ